MLEQTASLAFVAQRVATARGYDTGKPYDAAWEGLDREKPGSRKRPLLTSANGRQLQPRALERLRDEALSRTA